MTSFQYRGVCFLTAHHWVGAARGRGHWISAPSTAYGAEGTSPASRPLKASKKSLPRRLDTARISSVLLVKVLDECGIAAGNRGSGPRTAGEDFGLIGAHADTLQIRLSAVRYSLWCRDLPGMENRRINGIITLATRLWCAARKARRVALCDETPPHRGYVRNLAQKGVGAAVQIPKRNLRRPACAPHFLEQGQQLCVATAGSQSLRNGRRAGGTAGRRGRRAGSVGAYRAPIQSACAIQTRSAGAAPM